MKKTSRQIEIYTKKPGEQLSPKKYVSLNEGKDLYSMGIHTFRKMAEEAGAIYKIGERMVLVNTELFEQYLETFRIWRD